MVLCTRYKTASSFIIFFSFFFFADTVRQGGAQSRKHEVTLGQILEHLERKTFLFVVRVRRSKIPKSYIFFKYAKATLVTQNQLFSLP